MVTARTIALAILLVMPVTARVPAQVAPSPPFTTGISDPATLKQVIDGRVARARQLLEAMLAVEGSRTAANTLAPYDTLSGELYAASGQARIFASLHPDTDMRRTADELNRVVDALATEISLRADVYQALAAIEGRGLDAKTRYYLDRELKEFRLAGVDKPEETRQRLRVLRDELTTLMDTFARNIAEGQRQFTVADARELDGLPADFIERRIKEPGPITLTTSTADQRAVLLYARSGEVRRRMLMAAGNVAVPANVGVLDRILHVRFEIARLLGYPNWASLDAASRMAGDVDTISRFIDRVADVAAPRAAREVEELTRRKQQDEPGSALSLWDRQYYSELVRRASYSFDSQSVRPYFPFARVIEGLLAVTADAFAVTFRPAAGIPVWHPSVRVYEMYDGQRLLGRLYLDLHPRQGKRSISANVVTVGYGQEGGHVPEAVLAAALPGGEPGDPGLMTHDDVRMLVHELGHVVHRLVGGHQPWQKLSSLALERDFTEAPAQMLEEWAWDPRVLARFARHYESGEPIPPALVAQMRRASEFGQALDARQQMVLARVSLAYHDRAPTFDATELWKEMHGRYVAALPLMDGVARQASTPQLGQGGYASAYYTYMWSLVIAKDLFSLFEGRDLSSPGVARRFRESVFEPGSSRSAADIVTAYLGRPFDAGAWERWLNRGQSAN